MKPPLHAHVARPHHRLIPLLTPRRTDTVKTMGFTTRESAKQTYNAPPPGGIQQNAAANYLQSIGAPGASSAQNVRFFANTSSQIAV